MHRVYARLQRNTYISPMKLDTIDLISSNKVAAKKGLAKMYIPLDFSRSLLSNLSGMLRWLGMGMGRNDYWCNNKIQILKRNLSGSLPVYFRCCAYIHVPAWDLMISV